MSPHPLAAGAAALRRIGALLLAAALAGVLVAGLVLPLAGLTGFTARQVSDGIENLPEELEVGEISHTSKIYDANGHQIARFYTENREDVALRNVAPLMRKAIVAIEDSRFFQHGAIDLEGTSRALINNLLGNDTQGGSSITQQLIKLILIEKADTKAQLAAATEQSYTRKIRELQYAMSYEQNHSKSEILEDYLNIAFFGDGAYGIKIAARHYFSVKPADLSLAQSALLAGLVQNPTRFNPTQYPDLALERRNIVLQRMAELDIVSRQQAHRAMTESLGLDPTNFSNGCVTSPAPFFCDYVHSYLLANPALGKTRREREDTLRTGGLTIHTTVDLRFQRAADQAVRDRVNPTDLAIGGMAMVVPGTGEVKALSQSRPMGNNVRAGQTYLNFVVPKEYGDANGFQGGSTFKVFTLSSALKQGYPLSTSFTAPSPYYVPGGHAQELCGRPARQLEPAELHRHPRCEIHDVHGHPAVGQLLLCPARTAHRRVSAGHAGPRDGRRDPGDAGGAVVHPRGQRRQPGDDGGGLRHVRGAEASTASRTRSPGSSTRRASRSTPGRRGATGSWANPWPTPSTTSCVESSSRAASPKGRR